MKKFGRRKLIGGALASAALAATAKISGDNVEAEKPQEVKATTGVLTSNGTGQFATVQAESVMTNFPVSLGPLKVSSQPTQARVITSNTSGRKFQVPIDMLDNGIKNVNYIQLGDITIRSREEGGIEFIQGDKVIMTIHDDKKDQAPSYALPIKS